MNRPEMPPHTNEIAKYLLETENYILPPFIFNCNTPIKVFSYGEGAVKVGYAVISSNVELFVTDGQHRLKALQKVLLEKPELGNDSATVLVVQENDIEQIHQDFADCAKNKPIPPALLAAFDVTDVLSKLTRQLTKDSGIFEGRIDKISRTIGKDPSYLFTMNQLKIGDVQRDTLIKALASLDYSRDSALWDNSVLIDDGEGNKKIVTQSAAVDKGVKVALREVKERTGITLL
jgi:DGQHR domain-containing protein